MEIIKEKVNVGIRKNILEKTPKVVCIVVFFRYSLSALLGYSIFYYLRPYEKSISVSLLFHALTL